MPSNLLAPFPGTLLRRFQCDGARLLAALLVALAVSGCNSEPTDSAAHEADIHDKPRPAPVPVAPPNLADSLQLMVRQLDAVRRIGCWDEDFASLMIVHHAGAQRLAAVQISRGKDSTLRAMAQHVVKSHEKDTHVLALALKREPPAGQEYRPGNAKDPFVRRIAAALAPPAPGADSARQPRRRLCHSDGAAPPQRRSPGPGGAGVWPQRRAA
ncbi:DUF305 domain-containing protein [Hymenobacter sp. J193]|uniref:DUF305 domain-containing protein n=1 Tax=Hymenobacter sp. J193 TaxID=2898429 RepID=UPI0021508831|nr:DUF305 domain-containing protein [Hymenobacter sp. J193]MCR5890508.1 DUF305 domain-containing protein [Hymenobacter sp. J193]